MNVEDLFYPDVIEITSQEQMDKIKKYKTNIYNYTPRKSAYLFGKTNTSDGNGIADSLKSYDESYNKYKFSDIVFPDEEIMTKEEKEALLEEAKRRYPIGCTIKSTHSGRIFTLTEGIKWYMNGIIGNATDAWEPWLYCERKWSEVISYPEGYKQQEEEIIFSIY